MEILIDIFGSDDEKAAIYAGVDMKDKINSNITFVGKKEEIVKCIEEKYKSNTEEILKKIKILEASEYITNDDEPVWAIKHKKESSLVIALNYMKEHEDTVLISAGSTGAIMAGALLKLGRIDKIHRPALATILPTVTNKKVILLDSGANPQAKNISIIQYALIGAIYSKYVLDIKEPKIGLLNIGEEEKKGTPELRDIHKYLKENVENFTGNIESRNILNGEVDVVVCDGLMGNVTLKAIEGTANVVKKVVSDAFKTSIINKIKGVIVASLLKNSLKEYDYRRHGGAILLGVKKPVIKVHGSSNQVTFEKAILQATSLLENNIVEKIKEIVANSSEYES